jgi:hypothetical protein
VAGKINWTKVYEPADHTEAAVIMSLLRGADIECRLVQESVGMIYGLHVGSLGSIQIETLSSQQELALAIIAAQFDVEDMPESED